jgi:hypothetical protein
MTGSSWLRSYSINSLLVPAPRVAAPRAWGHLVGLLRDLLDALLALFDCWRRSNFDPLCRSEFDPGLIAGR